MVMAMNAIYITISISIMQDALEPGNSEVTFLYNSLLGKIPPSILSIVTFTVHAEV